MGGRLIIMGLGVRSNVNAAAIYDLVNMEYVECRLLSAREKSKVSKSWLLKTQLPSYLVVKVPFGKQSTVDGDL